MKNLNFVSFIGFNSIIEKNWAPLAIIDDPIFVYKFASVSFTKTILSNLIGWDWKRKQMLWFDENKIHLCYCNSIFPDIS